MNKKLFIFLLILITVINLTATVTILYERYSKPEHTQDARFMPPRKFGAKHDLTPEQLEHMKTSRDDFIANFKQPFSEFRELRSRLFEELNKEVTDSILIDSMLDEMGRRQTELRKLTIQHMLAAREQLSPDQRDFMMKAFLGRLDRDLGDDFFQRHEHGRKYKNRKFDGSGGKFQNHQPDSELNFKHGGAL